MKMPTVKDTTATFRAWLLSWSSVDSLRNALCFCTGTLLCLTPYAKLWRFPLSLPDQITFTVLGHTSKPVGGCWETIFNRYVGAVVFSTPCYVLLSLLGKQYTVQAILFTIFIFMFGWLGAYNDFIGGAALFAQTASVYAVTNSYRYSGAFNLDPLLDLLQSWSFGTIIALFYNAVFFPKTANFLLLKHFHTSLDTVKQSLDYLYSDKPPVLTAHELHDKLLQDVDRGQILLRQAAWEFAYGKATWHELQTMQGTLEELNVMLATCIVDRCAYRLLSGEQATTLERPVRAFHQACTASVSSMQAALQIGSEQSIDGEDPVAIARGAFVDASNQLTQHMLETLSTATSTDPAQVKYQHVATHCISLALPLALSLATVKETFNSAKQKSKRLQPHLLTSFAPLSVQLERFALWRIIPKSAYVANPFLPTPSLAQRALRVLTTDQAIGSLKVTIALVALMAILWSSTSRNFFLEKNVQTGTVPLILALMPTLGGSMIAWTAELVGTILGAVAAFATMSAWKGVGGASYAVPGITFFQLLCTLTISWRLAWEVDDMLAVLACFGFGSYVNKAWQLRSADPPFVLAAGLQDSAIVISIAIAIAVPMQFLVLRRDARSHARLTLTAAMRELSTLQEDTGHLFSRSLVDDNLADDVVPAESKALRVRLSAASHRLMALHGHVSDAKAEWAMHDGWKAERFTRQIAACQRIVASCDIAARILSKGIFSPEVRRIISPEFALFCDRYSSDVASTLWVQSAALSMLQPFPPSFKNAHEKVAAMTEQIEIVSRQAQSLDITSELVQEDLRRFWQLSQLLISQGTALQELEDLMSVDWKTIDWVSGAPEKPVVVSPGVELEKLMTTEKDSGVSTVPILSKGALAV